MKAPQAAGRIHTDFEKGFIMAEIMAYDDFKEAGSENACKVHRYNNNIKYSMQGTSIITLHNHVIESTAFVNKLNIDQYMIVLS